MDSNSGPLVVEATALSTVPQSKPVERSKFVKRLSMVAQSVVQKRKKFFF